MIESAVLSISSSLIHSRTKVSTKATRARSLVLTSTNAHKPVADMNSSNLFLSVMTLKTATRGGVVRQI